MKKGNARKHRKLSCNGKQKYPTAYVAWRVSEKMATKHQSTFQCYHCRYCKSWHIGHAYGYSL